jgi:hypothetical protein
MLEASEFALQRSMLQCVNMSLQVCSGLIMVSFWLLVDLVRDAISSIKAEGHQVRWWCMLLAAATYVHSGGDGVLVAAGGGRAVFCGKG